MSKLVHLCSDEVTRHLPPFSVLYNALRDTMVEYCVKRSVVQPVRQQLYVPGTTDRFIPMPAIVASRGVMGIKVVCAVPSNTGKGLPTHLGMIQLYKLTGELLCQMDAEEITAKRTAVCSALATKSLARPDSKILAILGAGVQARSHIWAISQLFELDEIRVWNRNPQRAVDLVQELNNNKSETNKMLYSPCNTIEEACDNADIICTVTSSVNPILFNRHVKPGAHINVVGASSPTTREVGDDLMLNVNVIVVADCMKAAKLESGDVVQSGATIRTDIGHVINSPTSHDPSRDPSREPSRDPCSITLFKNLGLACQDVVTAHLVYQSYVTEKETNQ